MSWRWTVNGQAAHTVDVDDRGFCYGDGVFETIAVRSGAPRFIELHLERLEEGCRALRIPVPDLARLRADVEQRARGSAWGTLKIIVTRGPGERGYAPPPAPRPTVVIGLRDERPAPTRGGAACLCATRLALQPATAGLKTLNRLDQVLARAEWSGDEFVEGLMLDSGGALAGGTSSNLFLVCDGRLLTPDLVAGGIRGIMRRVVLAEAARLGIACAEARLPPGDLYRASEVFVSNALTGLRPILALGDARWPVGPVTERLRRALTALGVEECDESS